MLDLLVSTLEVLVGIGLLFGGGEFFVQGSVALSLILGIPQLVIGLTIVSLGTSAPELFVSVNSFFQGSDALAVSNVVGSNIFNVMVVLGSSALVLPLKVESRLVRRDIPLLLAVSVAVWGMASTGQLTWQSGLALLIALLINTIWEIRTVREEPKGAIDAEPEINTELSQYSSFKASIKIIIGICLLTFGSKFLVAGASTLAEYLGINEVIIGLTIVSAGTSMPELITSLVASIKGKTDLAIGNVVGSSLLNQLFVLGSTSLAAGTNGLIVEDILIQKDIPIMILTTLACMPIFWTKGRISRKEGASLLGLYFLYLVDQILPIAAPQVHQEFRFVILFLVLPISLFILSIKVYKHWISTKVDRLSSMR